jgi:hypothetical protein
MAEPPPLPSNVASSSISHLANPPRTCTSGLAIASLLFGIFSILGGFVAVVPAVLSVVTGHLALRDCPPHGLCKGRGLALAGLILGWVSMVPWAVFSFVVFSFFVVWVFVSLLL